jgi:hypothetical protein
MEGTVLRKYVFTWLESDPNSFVPTELFLTDKSFF